MRTGTAVIAAPAIICPYSEVYAPCKVRKPGGNVSKARSFKINNGQRKSFHAPKKVMMPNVARAGFARGKAIRRKVWNCVAPSICAASSNSRGSDSKN